ncbi:putative FCP1 domain, HAD superfamily protein [Helianthus debilis subsp. tardiflorus]
MQILAVRVIQRRWWWVFIFSIFLLKLESLLSGNSFSSLSHIHILMSNLMTNVGIFLNVSARMEYAAAKRRKKISHATKEAHFDNRRKLLVLDVDVLLTHVAAAEGDNRIFKRLFCDEFLEFCFQRFNVGVWTSTTR